MQHYLHAASTDQRGGSRGEGSVGEVYNESTFKYNDSTLKWPQTETRVFLLVVEVFG